MMIRPHLGYEELMQRERDCLDERHFKIQLQSSDIATIMSRSRKDAQEEGDYLAYQPKQIRYISKLNLYLNSWTIALSSAYFGYVQIYLAAINFEIIIELYQIPIQSSLAEGILHGLIPFGAIFGSLAIPFLLSKLSRRQSLLFVNLLAFIAGLLIYIPNFYSFICSRLVQGICVGFYSGLPTLIIKQLVPVEISGTMGNLTQLNLNFGMVLGYLLAYVLKKTTEDYTCSSFWFIIFGVPEVTILIQSIMLIYVFPYDTPKYLFLQNNPKEAERLIRIIYKEEFVQDVIKQKLEDIAKIRSDLVQSNNIQYWSDIDITIHRHRLKPRIATLVALHVAIFLQLTGISVLNVYCGPIVEKKAIGEAKLLVPTLLNFVKMVGAFGGSYLLSSWNRKSIFQIGLFFLCIANSMIFMGFFMDEPSFQDASSILIQVGMYFFLTIFGATLGPVSWLYISEIVQPQIFSKAVAVIWVFSALTVFLFPVIEENVFDGDPSFLFLFFAVYCVYSLVVNHFCLVETKDKTQRQIQQAYQELKIC